MVNVDLSKVRLPDWAPYFLGVVPGLIFEAAVLISAPETAQKIVGDIDRVFRLPTDALLVGFVASAFVIGQIFLQLAWFADWLLGKTCEVWSRVCNKKSGPGASRKRTDNSPDMPDARKTHAEFAQTSLCEATRKLLKTRYGISLAERPAGEEWPAWLRALDKPPRYFLQGRRLARISLASGLAGFLALLFRPSLGKWYFFAACAVFSVTGLLIMWRQARWIADPDKLNLLMLQSALSDLAEARGVKPADKDEEE
ncbi:MAG: hypothetical protein ACLGQX_05980 [Acidobacteriota bacterium]